MTISSLKTNSNKFKVLREENNDQPQFEFIIKDDKLIKIKIYYPSGEILNETDLFNGKIFCYKIFKEKSIDVNRNFSNYPNAFIAPTNNNEYNNYNHLHNNNRFNGPGNFFPEQPSYFTGNRSNSLNQENIKLVSKLSYELNLDKDENLNNYKCYDLDSGKLTYEGGYLNRKKSGYGTDFYPNGNIQYQGNWLNDKMNDQGILYYENTRIKYQGRFLRGKRDGFGVFYYLNGNKKFEGNWKNDQMNDDNKTFYENGKLFMKGTFSDENFDGIKYQESGIKAFEGQMTLNTEERLWYKNGYGESYYDEGKSHYNGEWNHDNFDGYGTLCHPNGNIKFIGHFEESKFNGYGAKFDYNGNLMCMAQWSDDKIESMNLTDEHLLKGYQIIDFCNSIYVGGVCHGTKSGYGEIYDKTTGLRYFEGNHFNGKADGLCKQYYKTNYDHQVLHAIGYMSQDKWYGFRMEYYTNGKLNNRKFNEYNFFETGNKFEMIYFKDGSIDFSKSHKGEL